MSTLKKPELKFRKVDLEFIEHYKNTPMQIRVSTSSFDDDPVGLKRLIITPFEFMTDGGAKLSTGEKSKAFFISFSMQEESSNE